LFGPIEPQVDALGAVELPSTAIALCTLRYPDSGPLLRPLIERAAEGALEGEREKRQLVRALYNVGGRRDPLMFAPLLRQLRRRADEVKDLLGDVVTEGLPRIVAGVFDGNAEALFEIIADRNVDEYIRDASRRLGWATSTTSLPRWKTFSSMTIRVSPVTKTCSMTKIPPNPTRLRQAS